MMYILQIVLENILVASGVVIKMKFYYNMHIFELHNTYFLLACFNLFWFN